MGDSLVAEPTPTEQSPLSTNSVAFQSSATDLPVSTENFGVEEVLRAFAYFCDKNSLDKKQVALGLFLSLLLIIFSVGTIIAWNRYSPIIQEFIIKENIEKARNKSNEKNSQKRRIMNRFKKFLNKKRVETHFKRSGEGTRLDGQSSSSTPSGNQQEPANDAARNAALRRFEQSQVKADPNKNIRMAAKRDMERQKAAEEEERKEREAEEARKNQSFGNTSGISHSSEVDDEPENPANFQVYFRCEILEENFSARKPELLKAVEAELVNIVNKAEDNDDKVQAAIILMHMFATKEAKPIAIEMIEKICKNILEHPDDPKYKKVKRDSNSVQGKLVPAKGAMEFLKAVGFEEQVIDGDNMLVFVRDSDAHLVGHLEELRVGQTVPIKVSRELKLFLVKKGEKPKAPELSKDFFNLSIAEVRAEQKALTANVERELRLRTKEMRMKDEGGNKDKYKYTLIRVRLPNNVVIQGVFGAGEPFSAVRLFVASVLSPAVAASEFTLHDAIGQKTNDESISLGALDLAPTALLHLDFAETISESEELIDEMYRHLLEQQE